MKRLLIVKFSLSILLAAGTTLPAQSPTGTVAGIVTDATGAVMPELRIAIVNREPGLSRTSITDTNGAYAAASLPLGYYVVHPERQGFSPLERQALAEAG